MLQRSLLKWITIAILIVSMVGCSPSSGNTPETSENKTETSGVDTDTSANKVETTGSISEIASKPIPVEGNMLPDLNVDSWKNWSPREEITPAYERIPANGFTILKIKSSGKFEDYGKWICNVNDIKAGNTYQFRAEYKPENILSESVSIYSVLTWKGKDITGDLVLIQRDYVLDTLILKDGWKELNRTMEAPEGADMLEVELCLRWTENGEVQWRNPSLVMKEPEKHRTAKIVTTCIQPCITAEEAMQKMLEVIDMAGKEANPDAICLTESVYDFYLDPQLETRADTIPGKFTEIISEKAKQYNTYIVFSMVEKDDGKYYQTGVLIGRKGEIIGKYRKTHMPLYEVEYGLTPGSEYPIFDTDFGKVGIMICWDQYFPEPARILRSKGAEIIFLPTQGDAPFQVQSRAVDNGVYIVVAGVKRPNRSYIVNQLGELQYVEKVQSYLMAEIDLTQRIDTKWVGETENLFMAERRPDTYNELSSK